MATDAEMLQALNAAMATIGKTDQPEAESFLLKWKALLPFLPQTEIPPTATPEAVLLASFAPVTEDHKERYRQIQEQSRALIHDILGQI